MLLLVVANDLNEGYRGEDALIMSLEHHQQQQQHHDDKVVHQAALELDPAFAQFRDQTRFWVQRVAVPFIVLVGLFGNLITVIIMTRRRMRSTTNLYLAALAFVDMLYLILTLLLGLSHYPNMAKRKYLLYWKLKPFLMMLTDACSNTSVWLTVTFTIERFIAVRYPMKGKVWCTEARAKRLIVCIFVFAILYTLPVPFEWKVIERRIEQGQQQQQHKQLISGGLATGESRDQNVELLFEDDDYDDMSASTSASGRVSKEGHAKRKIFQEQHQMELAQREGHKDEQFDVYLNNSSTTNAANGDDDEITLTLENTEFGSNENYKTIYYWSTAAIFYFIPLMSLTFFNGFLIHSVHRSRRERNKMTNRQTGQQICGPVCCNANEQQSISRTTSHTSSSQSSYKPDGQCLSTSSALLPSKINGRMTNENSDLYPIKHDKFNQNNKSDGNSAYNNNNNQSNSEMRFKSQQTKKTSYTDESSTTATATPTPTPKTKRDNESFVSNKQRHWQRKQLPMSQCNLIEPSKLATNSGRHIQDRIDCDARLLLNQPMDRTSSCSSPNETYRPKGRPLADGCHEIVLDVKEGDDGGKVSVDTQNPDRKNQLDDVAASHDNSAQQLVRQTKLIETTTLRLDNTRDNDNNNNNADDDNIISGKQLENGGSKVATSAKHQSGTKPTLFEINVVSSSHESRITGIQNSSQQHLGNHQVSQTSSQSSLPASSQERRITIMLISVVILFLFCQIPTAAMLLYTSVHETMPNTNEHALLLAFGNIFNFLMAINAAGNFILYSFLSKKYRRTFVILFCACLRSKKSENKPRGGINQFRPQSSYYSTTQQVSTTSLNQEQQANTNKRCASVRFVVNQTASHCNNNISTSGDGEISKRNQLVVNQTLSSSAKPIEPKRRDTLL